MQRLEKIEKVANNKVNRKSESNIEEDEEIIGNKNQNLKKKK